VVISGRFETEKGENYIADKIKIIEERPWNV
jgi:hypothetical protein